jgi:hypothetical protein
MIELYISQNKNTASEAYGKYYPRVSYKQTMGIHEMAVHMAEHNTPFSEGTIEGILRDFVKCVREQTLNGNTVKVEISITPAEDQVPTATLNGSEVELTESGGVYTGNFAMPAQASTLVINTGTAEGDDGFDKD